MPSDPDRLEAIAAELEQDVAPLVAREVRAAAAEIRALRAACEPPPLRPEERAAIDEAIARLDARIEEAGLCP